MDDRVSVAELVVPHPAIEPAVQSLPRLHPVARELAGGLLPALLIALLMVIFVVQPTVIEGASMAPTLEGGERLVVDKMSYHFQPPQRGEIVVFPLPGARDISVIKRVIATAGERVAIQAGQVYLNGRALDEGYASPRTGGSLREIIVPEGYLFVLGDNRAHSSDSRHFGLVHVDQVIGRAVVAYWPLDMVRTLE